MLASAEIHAFRRHGALVPLPLLSKGEAAGVYGAYSAVADAADRPSGWDDNPHLIYDWAAALVKHPRLLSCVTSLLGPNILCWETDIFAKRPNSASHITWHQDITCWGLQSDKILTAWVALTPSNRGSGCMRVLPGSHLNGVVPHVEGSAPDNMLSRSQEIAVDVDEDQALLLELKAGEYSLHHVKIFHASGPNQPPQPRVGFAIRYMAADVAIGHGFGDFAMSVAGDCSSSAFELIDCAQPGGSAARLELHARVNAHRSRLNLLDLGR